VSQFRFDDKTGMLTAMTPAAATVPAMQGPRHLDFHPSGKYVYLSNEYGATVTTFSVKDDGTLVEVPPAVSGLPADFTARKWQSEIRVAPSGRFVYAGERVHETIAIFEVNAQTGGLTLKGHQPTLGKTPRNFMLDPSGTWMVVGNQESNSLISLRIDKATGGLTQAFGPVDSRRPTCTCSCRCPDAASGRGRARCCSFAGKVPTFPAMSADLPEVLRLLVLDGAEPERQMTVAALKQVDWPLELVEAPTIEAGLVELRTSAFHGALLAARPGAEDVIGFLNQLKQVDDPTPVVVLVGAGRRAAGGRLAPGRCNGRRCRRVAPGFRSTVAAGSQCGSGWSGGGGRSSGA
jgi:hypothetical protein